MIQLPLPPSVNNLFVNAGKRRVKSARYTEWLKAAGWELQAQKPAKVSGTFRFTMVAYRPDRRRRDLDNLIKPVLDLLKTHGVIEDDHLTQSIHATWADGPMIVPAHVRVTVEAA